MHHSPLGFPHRYRSRLAFTAPVRVGSDQDDSRQQSCAGGGTAQWRGLRGARPGQARAPRPGHPSGGRPEELSRSVPHTVTSFTASPQYPVFRCFPADFGQDDVMNGAFRGHRGVADRFRSVVVRRQCARHPLRRVMVETPPRAGPSPPHGPARFLSPPPRPALSPAGPGPPPPLDASAASAGARPAPSPPERPPHPRPVPPGTPGHPWAPPDTPGTPGQPVRAAYRRNPPAAPAALTFAPTAEVGDPGTPRGRLPLRGPPYGQGPTAPAPGRRPRSAAEATPVRSVRRG